MRFWIRFAFCALAVLLGVALAGCAPGQGQTDEEKEPHFVLGQSRVNAMDYPGAIEAFEESLEANPQSAAAHFELGWLYEKKASDPAAAIYHYERYLKLNPNAGNADNIRQRIEGCKQQLAADVLGLPSSSAAQQQLEKLAGAKPRFAAAGGPASGHREAVERLLREPVGGAEQFTAAKLFHCAAQSPARRRMRFRRSRRRQRTARRRDPRRPNPPSRAPTRSSQAKPRSASRANSASN